MRKLLLVFLILCVMITVAVAQEEPEIVLRLPFTGMPETIDPLLGFTSTDIQTIVNLFIGLTAYDPYTQEITPALAHSWDVSEDGITWTFHLRDDVPWVKYNTRRSNFDQLDFITAADVVYSVQRMCTDRSNGFYAVDIFAPLIAGCEAALDSENPADVQVSAPDEQTVVFNLTGQYSFFLSLTSLWTIRPVPQTIIAEYGDEWTWPTNIVTSGAFGLSRFSAQSGEIELIRNPHLPQAIQGPGNVDRVITIPFDNYVLLFDLGIIERLGISSAGADEFLNDPQYSDKIISRSELTMFYFGFTMDKPPMDNVHVRRAFAAAIDRQEFIDVFEGGNAIPMAHFTPEGVPYAPPTNAPFDVGYDPVFAREQLALAGYAGCDGLPSIEIMTYPGASDWAAFIANSVVDVLGCDESIFMIVEQDFTSLQNTTHPSNDVSRRPHLWTMGWSPDYNDAHTYISLLACGENNRFARTCNVIDEMINKGQTAVDQGVRDFLYTDIEEAFFGPNGEFPMIPLFVNIDYYLIQDWYEGPHESDGLFGGIHYDYYTLDPSSCVATAETIAVDLKRAPTAISEVIGRLDVGESLSVLGQTEDDNGNIWLWLENESWAPRDLVTLEGYCGGLSRVIIPDI